MLDISTTTIGEIVVLTAVGDVDIETAAAFREHGLTAIGDRPTRLVLDLSRVGFMDSTGIGALVHLRRRTDSQHGALHVVAGRRVAAALKLSHLDRVLSIHQTLEGALSGEFDEPA